MNKILGIIFISIPFIMVIALGIFLTGLEGMLVVFSFVAFVVGCIYAGAYFLNKNNK